MHGESEKITDKKHVHSRALHAEARSDSQAERPSADGADCDEGPAPPGGLHGYGDERQGHRMGGDRPGMAHRIDSTHRPGCTQLTGDERPKALFGADMHWREAADLDGAAAGAHRLAEGIVVPEPVREGFEPADFDECPAVERDRRAEARLPARPSDRPSIALGRKCRLIAVAARREAKPSPRAQ